MDAGGAIFTAITLTVLVEKFVAKTVTPIFEKFNWDKFWLEYIAWGVSGVLVFVAHVNFFSVFLPQLDPLTGQILSALFGGFGANILHDQTKPAKA